MKNQLMKFRCRLIQMEGILWWRKPFIEQDFEYVIGGHHYVDTALEEVDKYCKEQFGRWPRRIDNENMKSDRYWQIDLIDIGDRNLKLGQV